MRVRLGEGFEQVCREMMRVLRHRGLIFCVTLLCVAGLARLGWWQLCRAAEKEALQSAILAQASSPVLRNAELMLTDADADAKSQLHQRVHLRGHWQADATVYLDNRPMSGRVGFIVLTPLKLEGRHEAIAVQRGWIPRNASQRTLLVPVATPATLVEVEGLLAPAPSALFELGGAGQSVGAEAGVGAGVGSGVGVGAAAIRQNISLAAYGQATGLRLMPLSVRQQAPVEAPFVRDWPSPVVNVQKHYGYAFQWFAMCALVVGLYVWFQLIQPWRARTQ